jgi:hypothetical protein
VAATGRACRAIVAARLQATAFEEAALRALQFGWFTTPLVMDEDDAIRTALASVPGLDADAAVAALADPVVEEAYQRDRAEARQAAGSPAEVQGKAARTDGPVRFTAPTLVVESEETRLVGGGWQPVEAYDVLLANLDPTLVRRPPPDSPLPALKAFPGGLTTQEVTALLVEGNDAPDRRGAEEALIALAAEGRATRTPVGDDAIWQAA